MRKLIALFSFLFLCGAAFGQLSQFRMIGSGSWSVVNDSTFSSTVTIQADLTSNGFLPTGITDSMKVFSQTGQRYRISSATNLTFSGADLIVVESGGDWGAPVGQILIYENQGREAVPSIPFSATGSNAKMQEAAITYNSSISSGADNLGDHVTTQNIDQDSFWISPDGTSRGFQFPTGGGYIYESLVAGTYREQTTISSSTLTKGIVDDSFLSSQISFVKDATNPRLDFQFNGAVNWRIFKDHIGVIPPTSDPVDVTFGDSYFYLYPIRTGAAGTGVLKYRDGTSGTEETLATTDQIDSTRLAQDSILIYYAAGSEIGRDTIPVSLGGGGGAGGGHVIAEEGTAVTARDTLDFFGDGVSVASGATKTTVTIQDQDLSYTTSTRELAISGNGANVTLPVAGPSSSSTAGTAGLFPAAPIGSQNKFIRGDGQWVDVSGGGGVTGTSIDQSYPLVQFYENEFTDSIVGWGNFSSGTAALGTGDNAGTMRCIGLGVRYTGSALIEGQEYVIQIKISDPGDTGVTLYQEWADLLTTDTLQSGYYEYKWTQDIDGGSDQLPVIRVLNSDTAYIDYINLYAYNNESLVLDQFVLQDTINNTALRNFNAKTSLIWANDFETDASGVVTYSAPAIELNPSGYIQAILPDSTIDRVVIGYNVFDDGRLGSTVPAVFDCKVVIDVTIRDGDLIVGYEGSSGGPFSSSDTIRRSGVHEIPIYKFSGSTGMGYAGGLTIAPISGDTVQINSVAVYETNYNPITNSGVRIGQGAKSAQHSGVVIGNNAEADSDNTNSVVIGDEAIAADSSATYGGSNLNDATVVGNGAIGGGSRATAIGQFSFAAGQSASAFGFYSAAIGPHNVALGRGAIADERSTGGVVVLGSGGGAGTKIYGANGHAHKYPLYPTGAGGLTIDPSTRTTSYYGNSALDIQGTPDDFDQDAGHIAIHSGVATGSGASGNIDLYNAEGDNGANVQDTEILVGRFESDGTLTDGTHLWLRDESDNTLRRVRMQKDSSLYLGTTQVEDYGSASGTTDVSGDLTVSHSLGSASIFVNATGTGTTFYNIQVHTKTTTNFKIRFFDAAGSAITSTAVTADWFAKR